MICGNEGERVGLEMSLYFLSAGDVCGGWEMVWGGGENWIEDRWKDRERAHG